MSKGKIVWITGGGSGIGLAGGIELARAGAHVVISGRSRETLLASEKQIKAGSRSKKLSLIESLNPEWTDLYELLV